MKGLMPENWPFREEFASDNEAGGWDGAERRDVKDRRAPRAAQSARRDWRHQSLSRSVAPWWRLSSYEGTCTVEHQFQVSSFEPSQGQPRIYAEDADAS